MLKHSILSRGHLGLFRVFLPIWCTFAIWAYPADSGHAALQLAAPHLETVQNVMRYGFPPVTETNGLIFAGVRVPIQRADVRARLLREINYLLLDRRSRVLLWLTRADSLRPIILPILQKYKIPSEFIYLAAIESSYNGRALSSAGAFGYWQFIKSTAAQGPSGCDEYDWKMHITTWKDERGDLIKSTHSAARYLAWMNRVKKVALDDKGPTEGFNDWLMSAAAYNAGPSRVVQRINAFGASSYWDIPLPKETEQYVPRWMALTLISRNREFYGVQVPSRGQFNFDTVNKVILKKDLSFTAMARMLGISPRLVWELNSRIPAEKAVFPARTGKMAVSHTIHVPKGASKKFLAQLAAQGYVKKK